MSPLWPESYGSQMIALVGKRMESKGLIQNAGTSTSPLWWPVNVSHS